MELDLSVTKNQIASTKNKTLEYQDLLHMVGGYGTQFKITVAPNVMGNGVSPEWWKSVVMEELAMQKFIASCRMRKESGRLGNIFYSR